MLPQTLPGLGLGRGLPNARPLQRHTLPHDPLNQLPFPTDSQQHAKSSISLSLQPTASVDPLKNFTCSLLMSDSDETNAIMQPSWAAYFPGCRMPRNWMPAARDPPLYGTPPPSTTTAQVLALHSQGRRKSTVHATFMAGLPRNGWLYPLTKCLLRRANPWVHNVCKQPSVVPYPVPPPGENT